MSESAVSVEAGVPAHVQLIQMCAGAWVAAAVYAAAKLGLADHLAERPRSALDLATVTGTHAPTLHRFMRTLANFGILTEGDGQTFALTALGEALKTGAPGSARSTLIAFGRPSILAQLGGDPVFPGNREAGLRQGLGNADLRLPRATSG